MIQLKQNNDIIYQGFNLNENGLEPIGAPTFKQWEALGQFIRRSHNSVKFWHGDWLNYGQDTFDEWSQYFDEDDPNSEVYQQEMWVAKRVPQERRHAKLRWEHHKEVASLEPEDQDAMFKVAEENKMKLSHFKKFVSAYQQKLNLPELTDEQLQPIDPKEFEKAQEIVTTSIQTIELVEDFNWESADINARDFLLAHIKRAIGFYVSTLKKYDKQRSVSA